MSDRKGNWLLVGNCQVFGLANCLVSLAPGLKVEPMDLAGYSRDAADVDRRLDAFDRIIALDPVLEKLPDGAVDPDACVRLPVVAFSGFHPDLCYLAVDGPMTRGPLGHYHSAIAYAAFTVGMDEAAACKLFNRQTYEDLGYLAHWSTAREFLLKEFSSKGLDASGYFVAWSRRGQFMHTGNHPRIDVLMDVARMMLDHAGLPVVEPGYLPADNLVTGPVFPVYPEVAAGLGMSGNYRFKPGGSYAPLDLEEFVARSFVTFRETAYMLPEQRDYIGMISSVVNYLSGWSSSAGRVRSDGKKATYRGLFPFELKRRGDFPSCYVFGMHGSGSSFLHSLVQQVCIAAGIPEMNIPDRMFSQGLRDEWPGDPAVLELLEGGRVQYGFRELPPILKDPAVDLRTRRSVLLVQDPRDALVSRHAMTGGKRMPPQASDSPNPGKTVPDEFISDLDDYVLAEADALLRRMRDYAGALDGENVLVLRYEDVHRDSAAFAGMVFEHLGVRVPSGVLHEVAEANNSIRGVGPYAPGIHAESLRAETIATLNATFAEISRRYGYNLN